MCWNVFESASANLGAFVAVTTARGLFCFCLKFSLLSCDYEFIIITMVLSSVDFIEKEKKKCETRIGIFTHLAHSFSFRFHHPFLDPEIKPSRTFMEFS